MTVAAAMRSPDSSSTPAARSDSTKMRFTGGSRPNLRPVRGRGARQRFAERTHAADGL